MAAKLIYGGRRWVNTELKGNDVFRFRNYLIDMHINYELSEVQYGYTHFECLMTEDEMRSANEFIDTL